MFTPRTYQRFLAVALFAIVAFAICPLRDAIHWYGRPFAGILVDPDGLVSNLGLPTWDGFRQGLRFPHRILSVDGHELAADARGGYRARVWDRAIEAAASATPPRESVHVRVWSPEGERELDLHISPLDPAAFWLNGIAAIAIALLYVAGAFIALAASPRGHLARTFAKTTLLAALFLLTLFDYHTTRRFVPLFHLAFAMVPMGFASLALRLPDDVRLVERHPWIVRAIDATGLALGLAMVGSHLAGGTTAALRSVCTALFGASFLFFAVTFLVRFARAEGDRRATLRALLFAMVPAHVIIGTAFVLGSLKAWGATNGLLAVPALALTPLSSVVALIRHDLWGSRALLSRVLVRGVIVAATCSAAVALGASVSVVFGAPLPGALIASSIAGTVAGLLVGPALRVGDAALFPAHADYKPTIEQLSEELTLIADPEAVGHAVERTVRRWLPCEQVELTLFGDRLAEEIEAERGVRARFSSNPPRHREAPPRALAARDMLPPLPLATEGGGRGGGRPGSAELTIDVLFHKRPLAALRVGKKRGGALFTSEDVDLLQTIANQAALALAHAYSYAELELRRRQQAAAWRGEREALIETVAAEIAHEIRYPINYFRSIFRRGQASLRLDAEDVDIGCDEVERLERLVSPLRRVASHRLERQRITIEELCLKAERLLRDQIGKRALEVEIDGASTIRCDPDQVMQVLVNLLSNALDAAGAGGRVGVSWSGGAEGRRSSGGDRLSPSSGGVLTVWDSGPGFSGDPSRVFAPFYTTKPRGTGLGLAITQRIVRAHGWNIEPGRRDDRTVFVINIPASDVAMAASEPPLSSDGARGMEVA